MKKVCHCLLVILILPAITGCLMPRTTVVKNPGPKDKGIRYYRPKPYLLVQPTLNKEDKYVTISLQYLPDFEEEYSIKVNTGLGKNNTSIKLDQGWNLTEINQDLDSQFDENLSAVGDVLSAAGSFVKTSGNDQGNDKPAMVVSATNVPIGYYESVVSRDCHGIKRLYGWRYVGFSPFNSCPIKSSGLECKHCSSENVYALGFRKGVMVFEPIYEMASRHASQIVLETIDGSDMAPDYSGSELEIAALARTFLNAKLPSSLGPGNVSAKVGEDGTSILVTISAEKEVIEQLKASYIPDSNAINQELAQAARSVVPDVQSVSVSFQTKAITQELLPSL